MSTNTKQIPLTVIIIAMVTGIYASIALYGKLRGADFESIQSFSIVLLYYIGVYTVVKDIIMEFFK